MQEFLDDLSEEVLKKLIHSTSSSLSCPICQEIMFTPFILNCGHSFCYNCLNEWFKNRQECPLCRMKVKRPPSLNITLREIINGFTSILDSAKVNKSKATALKEYEADVNDHNLFQRTFNNLIETTLDRSDGVPRCSRCLWEAHGSSCLNCGATFIDDHDSDEGEGEDLYFSDSELEERALMEAEEEDDEDGSDGSSFLDDRDLHEINDDLEDPYAGLLGDDEEDDQDSSNGQWNGFSGDDDAMSSDGSLSDEVESAVRYVNTDVHLSATEESESESGDEVGTLRVRRTRIIETDDSDDRDC